MAARDWPSEAYALATRGRGSNEMRLRELFDQIQRMTGRPRRDCVNFVLRCLSPKARQKPWSEEEIERARELLAIHPPSVVAGKMGRSRESLRQMCKRQGFRMRELQCDFFTVASLARELRVRKSNVKTWIDTGLLRTSSAQYADGAPIRIDPEAVKAMIAESLPDLVRLGTVKSLALIQLYEQYCYAPKHTTERQLLQVREAKREREAYEEQMH